MCNVQLLSLLLYIGCLDFRVMQGGCKHLFMVTDIRVAHATDLRHEDGYPITTFQVCTWNVVIGTHKNDTHKNDKQKQLESASRIYNVFHY